MLQIKTFVLGENEVAMNEWLEKNYRLIVQGKDGPEIKIFGHQKPIVSIIHDKTGQDSAEYKREALTVELSIMRSQMFEHQRQLLDNIAKRDMFPEWQEVKGKHSPMRTAGWISHNEGIIKDRQQIKLDQARISVLEKLLANPESINGEGNQESKA